jgi:hypothetical protein
MPAARDSRALRDAAEADPRQSDVEPPGGEHHPRREADDVVGVRGSADRRGPRSRSREGRAGGIRSGLGEDRVTCAARRRGSRRPPTGRACPRPTCIAAWARLEPAFAIGGCRRRTAAARRRCRFRGGLRRLRAPPRGGLVVGLGTTGLRQRVRLAPIGLFDLDDALVGEQLQGRVDRARARLPGAPLRSSICWMIW